MKLTRSKRCMGWFVSKLVSFNPTKAKDKLQAQTWLLKIKTKTRLRSRSRSMTTGTHQYIQTLRTWSCAILRRIRNF